jgi:hypothetical protein
MQHQQRPARGIAEGTSAPELNLSHLTVEGLYEIVVKQHQEDAGKSYFWQHGISRDFTVEGIGGRLDGPAMAYTPQLWNEFKKEFHIFLCTKNRKYTSLRKRLSKSGTNTQLAIVSSISAAVGGSFGVVAGSLIPVCAICLIAVLKMGKEAFCEAKELNVKVGPE